MTKGAKKHSLRVAGVLLSYAALFLVFGLGYQVSLGVLLAVPIFVAAHYFGVRGALTVSGILTVFHGVAFVASVPLAQHSPALVPACLLGLLGVVLGAARDARLASQKKLAVMEQRFDRALKEAEDVLWEWDLNSGSSFFSGRFAKLLGTSGGEQSSRITEWFDRVHPEDVEHLKRAIEEHRSGRSPRFEHAHRLRRKDGSYVWVEAGGKLSNDANGHGQCMTGWITDVTEQRTSEAQLRRLAFSDALTGLPNRVLFMERLAQAQERARRRKREFAVLLVDLDRFKVINDSLGHALGDLLLLKVSRILREAVRPEDTIARLGGDEFVILLEDLERTEEADEVAAEVLGALTQPVEVEGQRVAVGASVGISRGVAGREALRPEDILREADIAMYEAKAKGGERADSFDPTAQTNMAERLELEMDLRRALDAQALEVHYQPIVDVESGVVVGFEGLARWPHPKRGMVSPGVFIPIAEEAGLIDQLGECVLQLACRDAAALKNSFPDAAPFRMGVNLSVAQLAQRDLCERVEQALARYDLPASYLSLEITESGLLKDTETAARIFARLRGHGVSLSMDDFGTGYSSLQYLRRFSIDTLKIDGSFVRDLEHAAGEEICATILSLGTDLGLSVVAEGVERPEELARLKRLGGRYAQGFLLSRPLPFEKLCAWLAERPGWRWKMAS